MLKKVALFAALCGVCLPSHAQTAGKENPFSFEGSYIGDAYYNALGGLRSGGGFMGMGNMAVSFDTGKARWWRGGSFFINGASIHGRSLTENYLGDLQVASNIDAGEHAYIHELWFRQEFSFNREGSGPSFTIGLQDMNAEFMASEGAGEYINSSFGVPSVVAVGVPVPIFPLTGLGVSARWDIDSRFAWQAAIFDGCQTPFQNNPHNLHWTFSKDDGLLAATEFHARVNVAGKEGTYKLGGYYHSGLHEHDPETQVRSTVFTNNYGVYLMVDQRVFERGNRAVGVFAQVAVAPKGKNSNNYYIGAGANLFGVFSKRGGGRDALGLAVAHAGLHGVTHKHETALELYYKYTFNDNFALQPDIQYIINPSGGEGKLPNALVGILRLNISF